MNIDMLFKLALVIVVLGLVGKVFKFLTSTLFKVAIFVLVVLFLYKIFII